MMRTAATKEFCRPINIVSWFKCELTSTIVPACLEFEYYVIYAYDGKTR
jgi:hypothetical protein